MRTWPTDLPSPLWRKLSRERFSAAPLVGERISDVVVIGAGVAGLTAALELAERGRRVMVLEAATVGAGASGRANGQVIAALTRHGPEALRDVLGEPFLRLLSGAADLLFDLVKRHNIDCDAVQAGWLQPAHSPGRLQRTRGMADQWTQAGVPASFLDHAEMALRLGTPVYAGGWENSRGGHINPYAFTMGLARAAAAAGVVLHEQSPALSLTRSASGWQVETPEGRVLAQKVVLATAAHTGDLWPGLRRSIVPVTSYQAATSPLGDRAAAILPRDHAFSDTRFDLRYMRKDREGRLVSGGALAVQFMSAQRLPALVGDRIARMFPHLGGVDLPFFWAGRIAMTVDRLPHLHRTPEGLVTWVGCNGRGLALSCAMAKVVADTVCDVPDAELALRPVSVPSVPFHPVVSRTARLALPWFRWQDSLEIAQG